MDPEVPVEVLAEVPASDPVATAAPDSVVETPDDAAKPAKTFSQEELDEIVAKRLARAERKWNQTRQTAPTTPAVVPPPDQFDSPEAYAEAMAEQKAEELIARREAAKQHVEVLEKWEDRVEAAKEKYPDFDSVIGRNDLPITEIMAESIRHSEVGPDVAYFLGQNLKEASRISKLPPFLQAKEIGRIEANIVNNPPVKKTTNAPAPIAPVTARSTNAPSFDTTDPRSIKSMSTSEWIEADRQRQIRKAQAQNR